MSKENRETIEKALEPYIVERGPYEGSDVRWHALAKEAIVIECEVVHEQEYIEGNLGPIDHGTWLYFDGGEVFLSPQFVSTSGKALAIILPLEDSLCNTET